MLEKVRRFITENRLFMPGSRVVAGFSGGADSVCLLEMLRLLAPELSLTVFALHVHHGIRGEEADGDAAFAAAFCGKRGIALRTVYRDIPAEARRRGMGLEEAGRLARREELARALRELSADAAALAHHKNDLAETMLFQLARGTGLAGLSGIPAKSGSFVRPLLCLTRAEIEQWLRGRKLTWREDSTNTDTAYARNRIRHEVLPELAEVNARAVAHIAEASAEIREAAEYLESLLPDKWRRCAAGAPECGRSILLRAEAFLSEPPLFQRMLAREAFRRLGGLKDLGKVHVEAVLDLMRGGEGRQRNLPGMRALRTADGVLLAGEETEGPGRTDGCAAEEGRPCAVGAPGPELTEEGIALRIPGETICGGWRFTAAIVHMPEERDCGGRDLVAKDLYMPEERDCGGRDLAAKDLYMPEERDCGGRDLAAKDLHMPEERDCGGRDLAAKDLYMSEENAGMDRKAAGETGCGEASGSPADASQHRKLENDYTKWFDYDKIEKNICVRRRRKGDYLVIHPNGQRKTISNLFTDRKVPRGDREDIALLAAGQEVLWAVGVRGGESARVGEESREILRVSAERTGNGRIYQDDDTGGGY